MFEIPSVVIQSVGFGILITAGRYIVVAALGAALVFYWARRRLTRFKIRAAYPSVTQMRQEFFRSLRSAVVFQLTAVVGLGLAAFLGRDAMRLQPHVGLGIAIALIFPMLLVHDAYFYWTHRAFHLRPLFRFFHQTHHLSHNPSPFAAFSFSVPEAIVNSAFLPIYLISFPMPIVTTFGFITLELVLNVLGHTGIELFPTWAVIGKSPLLNIGTTHHDIHHAAGRYNYGLYFRIWDRLMGTEHPQFEAMYQYVRSPMNDGLVYRKYMKLSSADEIPLGGSVSKMEIG